VNNKGKAKRKAEADILQKLISPLGIVLTARDALQIVVGASILAIPVGFTEETWHLGASLPLANVTALIAVSLIFIGSFVYYNYYMHHHGLKKHGFEFLKRVLATYVIAFLVVGLILSIIEITPWSTDFLLAFKRTAIVSFPASMSAAVADTLK